MGFLRFTQWNYALQSCKILYNKAVPRFFRREPRPRTEERKRGGVLFYFDDGHPKEEPERRVT